MQPREGPFTYKPIQDLDQRLKYFHQCTGQNNFPLLESGYQVNGADPDMHWSLCSQKILNQYSQ